MLKDISELENRLFDIALQAPDDGGDIFDDAFADPADLAEKKEARKEAAAKESASKPPAAEGVRRASGMDRQMKKRQEETAAEVLFQPCASAKVQCLAQSISFSTCRDNLGISWLSCPSEVFDVQDS